ncbi:MAG TPA: Xaa-Pro peptidase family protein [Longimicrobiales bacterium]|nr:Xaa-Pro peptidase family protein [Longimicrobiales bacterium]
MGIDRTQSDFGSLQQKLPEIQESLREQKLDGWLLWDMRARNGVASKLLGLGEMSRRYFVFIPREGEPNALTHGIEQGPWKQWRWRKQQYVGWQELEQSLSQLLDGAKRIAMEISEGDAVPVTDLVPHGVVELVRRLGVDVSSSGDLITRFHSRWTDEEEQSHRRASVICAQVAHAAFQWLGGRIGGGETVTEGELHDWVVADLARRGAPVEADCIAATGVNAADPHYGPDGPGATFRKGDVVLLDLWARESTEGMYADQTWMAYLGASVPERVGKLFGIVRDARDAAISTLMEGWAAQRPVRGADLDDAARNLITNAGYGAFFIHRTGHSIDQSLHGSGPNIDNLETRETRLLLPGIGFSVEPGIYLAGDIGLRTEINMYVTAQGPDVTTPKPQDRVLALLP